MFDSIALFRVIKTGFVNFWRNLWLSTAATMVMTITLVIFAVLFLLFGLTSYSIKTIQNTVDVSVYFKTGLAEQQILSIKSSLETDPKIKTPIQYVSAQQALDNFKKAHSDQPLISGSLSELDENPLPATLHVKAYNLSDYPAIVDSLQADKYKDFISQVNYKNDSKIQKAIDRLDKILHFITTGGIGLIIVFSLIAILVIFNTITLTIHNRKEEVEIMRLVGATNWYIRGPFLVESFLYSLAATVLTGILFIPIFNNLLPKIEVWVSPEITLFNTNIFNYWSTMLMLIVISVVLSMFTTLVAMRKYLRI